ncbi:MAG: S49 family peptidase [Burkholderiaceae bacterium]
MTLLPHIAGRVFDAPLLIARAKLDTILGVLVPRLRGESLPFGAKPVTRDYEVENGIAVIPVVGTLVRRTIGLEAQSGLMSYGLIAERLDAALQDNAVKAILLDIDSPGGEAGGVFDLADKIFAARKVKPIWAVANDEAFSAAYAIAAAADRIYLSRTGGVGSIGVIAVHLDQSVAEADAGLKYTAIYAGEHKNDLSPHEPLSDPARAQLQTEVDRVYALFTETVARMRGLDLAAIKETEAALYFGEQSVAAGLADRIGTMGDALSDLTKKVARPSSPLTRNLKRKETPMTENNQPVEDMDPEMESIPDLAALKADLKEEAKTEAMAYVAEVTELCQLAGVPDKAAAFITKAVPAAEVRKALLETRAAQADATAIAGQIPANANPTTNAEPKIDTAAIYAARNKKGK